MNSSQTKQAKEIIERLNAVFDRPEALALLKPYWRRVNQESGIAATGFCYIASEVLFHAMGGRKGGYCVKLQKIASGTHWWVEKDGITMDPTSSQLTPGFTYEGRGGTFLTTKPSARAVKLAAMAGIKV